MKRTVKPREPHPVICDGGPFRGKTVAYAGNMKVIPVCTNDRGEVLSGAYHYERRWMGGRSYVPYYQWRGPINPEWT